MDSVGVGEWAESRDKRRSVGNETRAIAIPNLLALELIIIGFQWQTRECEVKFG